MKSNLLHFPKPYRFPQAPVRSIAHILARLDAKREPTPDAKRRVEVARIAEGNEIARRLAAADGRHYPAGTAFHLAKSRRCARYWRQAAAAYRQMSGVDLERSIAVVQILDKSELRRGSA